METTNNYKRTVSGSVGAGMGAIFNGSGRTYYILEHKTSSRFHQAGETQKIIIDQIELGRDGSCQVRFDESLDTVSRHHAAIVREGNGWKLVHLSHSNPTLVNGQPIQGTYYLKSGDEIQLSVGGPRMGFIQPQGAQAMTSSIKLTERMNLFRQQALRPYRTAIWVLAGLLLLAIVGFGIWNYRLNSDNQDLRAEMNRLVAQADSLNRREQELADKLAADPTNTEVKDELAQVHQERERVVYRYNTIVQQVPSAPRTVAYNLDDDDDDDDDRPTASSQNVSSAGQQKTAAVSHSENESGSGSTGAASDDIAKYADDVYIIKIDRIQVEYGGMAKDPGIATAYVNVGTGFRVNGSFVTARCNIQPWVYRKGMNEPWRDELARYKALGFNIRIWFSAYSTKGTTNRIQFDTDQINMAALESNDMQENVTITKEFINVVNVLGYNFAWKEYKSRTFTVPVYTAASHSAVRINVGSGSIPSDNKKAATLKGGEEIQIAGYHGVSQHSISGNFDFTTSHTRRASGYFITLQGAPGNDRGYLGSPAFYKGEDGQYRVVGVYVGSWGNEASIVPLTRI